MKLRSITQLLPFLLLPIFLMSETTSSVSSREASYNGNILTLQGNVEVDHALGKMCAGFAKMMREDKSSPFSYIQLRNDVTIALHKRGEIHCETANLDFISLMGTLFPKIGDTIHFTNVFAFQDNAPLSIESDTAEIKFLKEDQKIYITEASVKDHVVIHFTKDIALTTNQATFQGEKNADQCTRISTDSPCRITHFADIIDAQKVIFYPLDAKILLLQPEGTLKNFSDKKKDADFQFSASQGEVVCAQESDQTSFKSLHLTGDVQLSRSLDDSSCCAIADNLSYFPETSTAILSAEKGKSVLFWDAEQDLSISADEVHITHTDDGNMVKGVGVVRFAFSSHENALLKKLFPFYQPAGESHE